MIKWNCIPFEVGRTTSISEHCWTLSCNLTCGKRAMRLKGVCCLKEANEGLKKRSAPVRTLPPGVTASQSRNNM